MMIAWIFALKADQSHEVMAFGRRLDMGKPLTYWRPSLPLNWITGMRNLRRRRLASFMVDAASFFVVAISLGQTEAAASDALSGKSATATGASTAHNPTTPNRAWVDPTRSSR